MRDRLIELFDNWGLEQHIPFHTERAMLADYLLANGVIVPPCKVGDTVYFKSEYVHGVLSDTVENIRIQSNGITVHTVANKHLWGDEVFLTREEAERALKGGADNG